MYNYNVFTDYFYCCLHFKNNWSLKVSCLLPSFLFISCFWQNTRQPLFILLFQSSCSLPSPLLALLFRSLCPGSHYCIGKYFIGLNTFAHSHLPATSPLTHRPWIDRSKWKRAKWRWRREWEKEKRSVRFLSLPPFTFSEKWGSLLCILAS